MKCEHSFLASISQVGAVFGALAVAGARIGCFCIVVWFVTSNHETIGMFKIGIFFIAVWWLTR